MVNEALSAGARRLVFPAEVSAAFWRGRLAHDMGAVWSNSVMSWDRFKEESFGVYESRRPANRLMRRIFVERLLGENAREPILEVLIAPEYAGYSARYAGAVTGLLPILDALLRRAEEGVPAPLIRDLGRLFGAYRDFLDEHMLFEPRWRSTTFTEPDASVALIACNLATDFPEFRDALSGAPGVSLYPAPTGFGSETSLARYPNTSTELSDTLLRIEGLLDEGVPAEEIALTVADLSGLRDRVRLEADKRGVPVVLRQGQPLSDYPGVALFRLLSEAHGASYRYERMRDLVFHHSIPWTDAAVLRHGLTRAADQGRLWFDASRREAEPSAEPNREPAAATAATAGATASAGATKGIPALFELSRNIRGIVTAPSFAKIRERLYAFFNLYLNTNAMSEEEERAFQAALDVLTDLAGEEERGLPELSDPFGFFLTMLSDRQYVPKERGGGIGVYPYRVSAAMEPRYHFVVNASQGATKVSGAGVVQLIPESSHEALGLAAYDVSDAMLYAYGCSGAHVRFSVAERGTAGAQLPAGTFTSAGIFGSPAELVADPLLEEERYLARVSPDAPRRLYPRQRRGLERIASTIPRAAWMDRSRSVGRLENGETELPGEISVTAFERYWNCPFGYLMEFLFGAREVETLPAPSEPRHIGTLYHRVLQGLYEWIADTDGVIEPSHYQRYVEQSRSIVRQLVEREGATLRVTSEGSLHILLDQITASVLAYDVEHFAGYEIFDLEGDYAFPARPDPQAAGPPATAGEAVSADRMGLHGRIDRILRNPDSGALSLVDYKRRNTPGKRRLRVELEDHPADTPGSVDDDVEVSLQMAAYVYLLERSGHTVESAAYYGLEEASVKYVFGGPGRGAYLTREEMEVLVSRVDERLRAMPERFRNGDFRAPDPDWGCTSCRLRGVCRHRFSVGN